MCSAKLALLLKIDNGWGLFLNHVQNLSCEGGAWRGSLIHNHVQAYQYWHNDTKLPLHIQLGVHYVSLSFTVLHRKGGEKQPVFLHKGLEPQSYYISWVW